MYVENQWHLPLYTMPICNHFGRFNRLERSCSHMDKCCQLHHQFQLYHYQWDSLDRQWNQLPVFTLQHACQREFLYHSRSGWNFTLHCSHRNNVLISGWIVEYGNQLHRRGKIRLIALHCWDFNSVSIFAGRLYQHRFVHAGGSISIIALYRRYRNRLPDHPEFIMHFGHKWL